MTVAPKRADSGANKVLKILSFMRSYCVSNGFKHVKVQAEVIDVFSYGG